MPYRVLTILFFFLLSSCSTFQLKVDKAYRLIRSHNFDKALEILEPLAQKDGVDQLVYLLEYGTALQLAGKYKESIEVFRQADEMSEVKDYHSLSKITASLLLNEGMMQYKGEDFEKVLINVMLAIDYLMLNDFENALVEVRRINEKLYLYKTEAKRNYEQNPFAFYLGAMIWENEKKWDDAYIDFKKTYDLNANFPYLKEDLIRSSLEARRRDAHKKWIREFGKDVAHAEPEKGMGELVLIYQQGMGPIKRPNPSWHRVPKLYPRWSNTDRAQIVIDGHEPEKTQRVYDLESVAIKSLDDAYAGLVAKRLAGIAAKEVVADQVRQKNELLGALMRIGMHIADQADLRQWSLLPKTIQVAKMYLKPGTYQVKVEGLSHSGDGTGENSELRQVEVVANQKTFILWRSFN